MKNIKISPKTWAIALGIVWLALLGGYFAVQKNSEVVVAPPELAPMER